MGSGLPKPIGIGSLDARLRALEEAVRRLDGARRLASATISEGGLDIVAGGNLGVHGGGGVSVSDGGDIAVTGGGDLSVAGGGDATIAGGGSLTITEGDLILGEGMIQGDALANQISASQTQNTATGFHVTNTSYQNKASATVQVPSWATTALVIATGYIRARINLDGAGDDSVLRSRLNIGGSTGDPMNAWAGNEGGTDTYASNAISTWTDTLSSPGSSFTVALQARSLRSIWYPSDSQNRATVNVMTIFMR